MDTCKPMFDQINNLPVDIRYGLTATWSISNHTITDDLQTQKLLGSIIINAISKDTRFSKGSCRHNGDYLKFLSNVIETEMAYNADTKNESDDFQFTENKDTNFILQTILLTTDSCQLQDVIDRSLKPFLEPLTVHKWNGDLVMKLAVSIASELGFDAHGSNHIYQFCHEAENPELCVPESAYLILNETQCPKIGVTFSELSRYHKDSDTTVISSMFPGNRTKPDEVVYTCIDDYYRWLDLAGVRPHLVNSHADSVDDILPNRLSMLILVRLTLTWAA